MDITLYYQHRTRAFRPRWLLEELDMPYRLELVDIFSEQAQSPEYRAIHPHGAVPAMRIDGHVMIESAAMCHWLADQRPDKALAPALDDPARMDYEQWMFYLPGTLEPLAFQIVLHSAILPEKQRVKEIVPWATRRYLGVLKTLNAQLEGRDYLVDERFTTADILIGATLLWLPDTLKKYPALKAYTDTLQQRPAFQRASKDPSQNA